jgi:hypothetical protein
MHPLMVVTLIFGGLVWMVFGIAMFAVAVTLAIQLWEAACVTGYRVFVSQAEKDAIRQRAALSTKGGGDE